MSSSSDSNALLVYKPTAINNGKAARLTTPKGSLGGERPRARSATPTCPDHAQTAMMVRIG